MTLEQRLADALHSIDDYQPSIDLFARTTRSIVEDRAHRRRIATYLLWAIAGAAAIGLFLASQSFSRDGDVMIRVRDGVVVWLAVAFAILLCLGPVIRRYGKDFIHGAFAVSPGTGAHFSKVLDLAYYLAFGGAIIAVAGGPDLDTTVTLVSALTELGRLVAALVLFLGLVHAINLVAIPLLALIVNASTRRVLRHMAGGAAPPESVAAARADRVAKWILYAIAAIVVFELAGLAIAVALGSLG